MLGSRFPLKIYFCGCIRRKFSRDSPFWTGCFLVSVSRGFALYFFFFPFQGFQRHDAWDLESWFGTPLKVLLWWLSPQKITRGSPLFDWWDPDIFLREVRCPLWIFFLRSSRVLGRCSVLNMGFCCEWFCGDDPCKNFVRNRPLWACWFPECRGRCLERWECHW